jgi:ADP-heptose:LPS heptosyltransferase
MFDDVKKILIVRLSAIGDVIMTFPAVAAIRKRFPDAYIAYATEPNVVDIVKSCPYINDVIVLNFKEWKKNLFKSNTWKEILTLIREIKSKKFDLSINFHIMLRAAFTSYIAAPKRIGYDDKREFNDLLMNYKISDNESIHMVDKFLDIAKFLGADIKKVDFKLNIPDEDKNFVEKFLDDNQIKEKKFIIIAPFSSKDFRQWSYKNYAKLIDMLYQNYNLKIIVDGTKEQISKILKIHELCLNKPIISCGINLRRLACLIKKSALFIGCDSAPMHISVTVGTPVVAIWVPSNPYDPEKLGPYGNDHIVVRKCENVEEVFNACKHQLKKQGLI